MRTIIFIILSTASCIAQAQNSELDSRNGFKDIKLLSNATEYAGLKFDKNDDEEFKAIYSKKSGYFQSIGEIEIKDLKVYTYNDLIYRIEVVADKDPRLFKGLEKAFGEAKYSVIGNDYVWQGENVKLSFASHPKGKMVVMKYSTYLIKNIIKQDKEQVIEDLSDDF